MQKFIKLNSLKKIIYIFINIFINIIIDILIRNSKLYIHIKS